MWTWRAHKLSISKALKHLSSKAHKLSCTKALILSSYKALKLFGSKDLKLFSSKALNLLSSKAFNLQSYQALKLQTYIKFKTCTDLGVAHAPPLTSSLSSSLDVALSNYTLSVILGLKITHNSTITRSAITRLLKLLLTFW